jgi:hypothetical protein
MFLRGDGLLKKVTISEVDQGGGIRCKANREMELIRASTRATSRLSTHKLSRQCFISISSARGIGLRDDQSNMNSTLDLCKSEACRISWKLFGALWQGRRDVR